VGNYRGYRIHITQHISGHEAISIDVVPPMTFKAGFYNVRPAGLRSDSKKQLVINDIYIVVLYECTRKRPYSVQSTMISWT
jgi:hypothetical protein